MSYVFAVSRINLKKKSRSKKDNVLRTIIEQDNSNDHKGNICRTSPSADSSYVVSSEEKQLQPGQGKIDWFNAIVWNEALAKISASQSVLWYPSYPPNRLKTQSWSSACDPLGFSHHLALSTCLARAVKPNMPGDLQLPSVKEAKDWIRRRWDLIIRLSSQSSLCPGRTNSTTRNPKPNGNYARSVDYNLRTSSGGLSSAISHHHGSDSKIARWIYQKF